MRVREVMLRYLVGGQPVGRISRDLNTDRSSIKRVLKENGITIRPTGGSYSPGRDVVCEAVKRSGYASFHAFVQVRSLDPITEQSSSLEVSERSLTRVYNSYRRLLAGLKSARIVLPTSQLDGVDLERRRTKGQPT